MISLDLQANPVQYVFLHSPAPCTSVSFSFLIYMELEPSYHRRALLITCFLIIAVRAACSLKSIHCGDMRLYRCLCLQCPTGLLDCFTIHLCTNDRKQYDPCPVSSPLAVLTLCGPVTVVCGMMASNCSLVVLERLKPAGRLLVWSPHRP